MLVHIVPCVTCPSHHSLSNVSLHAPYLSHGCLPAFTNIQCKGCLAFMEVAFLLWSCSMLHADFQCWQRHSSYSPS